MARNQENGNYLKVFPELGFYEASREEINRYKHYFSIDKKYIDKEEMIEPPAYIGGYDYDYIIDKIKRNKTDCFDWKGIYKILKSSAKKTADEIIDNNKKGIKTVGVHVRRGDMAVKVEGGYWQVLTAEYFLDVLKRIDCSDRVIYFFSNGFDFVEDNIISHFEKGTYKLVKGNLDYEDMYLYSLCKIQIASQSSWGNAVFPLNNNKGKILYRPSLYPKKAIITEDEGKVITVQLTREMYV